MFGESFRTSSGRIVLLEAVHVRRFDCGIFEGEPHLIRRRVMGRLAEDVRRIFPGPAGLFISPDSGPGDSYPTWIVVCDFVSAQPVETTQDADGSGLIVAWFTDDFSRPIPEFVGARIGEIDWESHAVSFSD